MLRAARYLTFASALSVLVSIAVSQIFLAMAFAALLVSGERLRLPRFWLPLSLFLLGTLLSLAFSGNVGAGLPQVRKFYVFLELLVVYSLLRKTALLRRLVLCWGALATAVAALSFAQFAAKVQEANALGRNFYDYYVAERITGFMSHWMTFSGLEMFAFLMLVAYLFFAPGARRWAWVWLACAALMSLALLLGFTRSIWLASAAGMVYLLWCWRRWLVALAPVVILLAFVASPPSVRERFTSMVKPRKGVDSNEHRMVTWRTGLQMIRQHPWLGLGPEEVKLRFDEFVPADIPRPLPEGWYGHLHNIYLHYAAERGIPTMLALVWALLRILLDFWRGVRLLPPGRSDRKFLLHGGISVVLATMIAGCFELNLGDSEVLAMFLVVVGAGYVALDAGWEQTAQAEV